jgi:hypothetical protein
VVDVRSEIWIDCGKACPRCNEALVSPDCSEFVSERLVLNHWRCSSCGAWFDSAWTPGLRVGYRSGVGISSACGGVNGSAAGFSQASRSRQNRLRCR